MPEIRNYTMNFGPQHPAAHGVLRLVLEMDGEMIQKADPHVGLLHRATEKLAESKPFNQSIGYMDRLDYVSMMCNEHAYVMAIEKLLGLGPPLRAQYIRVMFDEITRILNHLMWLGAHGLDIGAMTVFLYCFREREDLMDGYEAVSGTRMHATIDRPGGEYRYLPEAMPKYQHSEWCSKDVDRLDERRSGGLFDFIADFAICFPSCIDEYETPLTDNRIRKQRTVNIGVVSPERAMQLGFSVPMLRGSGIERDRRKSNPTTSTTGSTSTSRGLNGDRYDRYPVRIEELRQSTLLIARARALAERPSRTGYDRRPQGSAASAREHEGRHGILDSPFQTLHRRILRTGRRSVCGGRSAEGRTRRVLGIGRREQALSPEVRAPGFPYPAALDGTARGQSSPTRWR